MAARSKPVPRPVSDAVSNLDTASALPENMPTAEADEQAVPNTEDQVAAARTICLRLLTSRPRTAAELAAALAKRGIHPEAAEIVLARLTKAKLIDDAAFAESWVQSRQKHRGLSKRALGQELRHRGVSDETIEAATADIDPGDERAAAANLVAKRLKSMAGLPPETQARRLLAALARRGYSSQLASRVVREALNSADSAPRSTSWTSPAVALESLADEYTVPADD